MLFDSLWQMRKHNLDGNLPKSHSNGKVLKGWIPSISYPSRGELEYDAVWGMVRIRDVENQNPASTYKFSIGQLVVVDTRCLGWSLTLKGKLRFRNTGFLVMSVRTCYFLYVYCPIFPLLCACYSRLSSSLDYFLIRCFIYTKDSVLVSYPFSDFIYIY